MLLICSSASGGGCALVLVAASVALVAAAFREMYAVAGKLRLRPFADAVVILDEFLGHNEKRGMRMLYIETFAGNSHEEGQSYKQKLKRQRKREIEEKDDKTY